MTDPLPPLPPKPTPEEKPPLIDWVTRNLTLIIVVAVALVVLIWLILWL